MKDQNSRDAIIEHLEHVRNRPEMYAGEVSERAFYAYLSGFDAACTVLGHARSYDLYLQVCEERGWGMNALGPQKRMREMGLSEQAIVDELLTIEIETRRRFTP